MELTEKLLSELQRRLKIGNRRGVHLNAIPANSRYKFDLDRLSYIDKNLPNNFIEALLTELPLKFRVSWKDNVPDLNTLFEEDQSQLVRITKAFENLINQTEAIESEKGINTFGFGFPILVRRDEADNKLTVAPVLIWSLKIKRTKEFNTWEILRDEEDPIYLNEVLINHLRSDSNVEIEQIPNEMIDDGLISKDELIEICVNLIKAINTNSPEDLKEIFKTKLENITSIGDKSRYEKLPLNSTNSFIDFGGLFSIFEVQKQNIINDYSDLMELQGVNIPLDDLEGHYFQPISSVETDPSQQSILHSLEETRNILIQGPPGTGKSQTLTAILMNALENNKRTIVVCEKRTALEVLHNALIERGLSYQCALIRDIVKDRKTVVDSVRYRIDNSEYKKYKYNYSKESLSNITSKAKKLISSINKKHKKVGEEILGTENWTKVVGKFLKETKEHQDDSNLSIDKNQFKFSSQELNNLLDVVQNGQNFYKDFLPIESKSFINPLKLIGDNPYIIEQKLNEDFELYSIEVQRIKSLINSIKTDFFNLRKTELKTQFGIINENIENLISKEKEFENIYNSARDEYFDFRNSELSQQLENLSNVITHIELIINNNKDNSDLMNQAKVNSLGFKILSNFSKTKKQTIADHNQLQTLFLKLQKIIEVSKDISSSEFSGTLESKKNLLSQFKKNIEIVKIEIDDKIENEFKFFKFDSLLTSNIGKNYFRKIQTEIINIDDSEYFKIKIDSILKSFETYIEELQNLIKSLSKNISDSEDVVLHYSFKEIILHYSNYTFEENKIIISKIKESLKLIQNDFDDKIQNEFNELSLVNLNYDDLKLKNLVELQDGVKKLTEKVKSDKWTNDKIVFTPVNKLILNIENLIEKKNQYFNLEKKDCFTIEFRWFQFYNSLSDSTKIIINELKHKKNWRKSFLIYYLNSMLVNSATMDLPVDEDEHIELESTLNELEKEQLKFIKEFWFSKQIDVTRDFEYKNNGLSVENLYNKRSSNRFKRLSLRQIVQKEADLFTTFFPIILTSPDVASNLFKGMNGYFDIVMFDEASQLRIEDNLPAILKGKQIVIAGDEHQMPPSNYFSKVFDGMIDDEEDLEEEDEIVVDKDNLLLSCESLLDFGTELNFQKKHLDFHYRSRHPFLIDFSNYAFYNQRLKPLPNNFDYTPIKYVAVNGTFSEHTNEAEAEMVLSILENNINRLPNGEYPTIGIATFNIAQRNLIKSKILERQKFSQFNEFNTKIQELEENGLFIKNLENIQGDERDVIIISTTYGVGKEGKFAQRFGPINHSKGYKLLNVIITRAKFKVYICTSIPEEVFMNYKEHLIVEGSNNKKSVLYAYLAYCKAVSENNHDLRLSVLTSLSENTTKTDSIHSFRGGDLESPFEEEVYQNLADYFGTENLIPQFPFAEFRIDIVYDSKIIGVPKIAIECDGAKYHSSREAYLYDRHRQKMLENHGFVFHRIWSTNWWRNSKKETEKLIDFINQNDLTGSKKLEDHSKTAFAFTDDIEVLEEYVSKNYNNEKDAEIIDTIKQEELFKEKKTTNEIKLNSKVHIKYVNNNKDFKVELVSNEVKTTSATNGIQKIYYKSPLANSIMGHTIGDIVKVGDLDNFVEIIKLLN